MNKRILNGKYMTAKPLVSTYKPGDIINHIKTPNQPPTSARAAWLEWKSIKAPHWTFFAKRDGLLTD